MSHQTEPPERTATAAELADERAKLDRAASGAWRDVALAVPCPECKRPAGVRCITLDTHQPTDLVHRMRAAAAERAKQEPAPAWLPTPAELAGAAPRKRPTAITVNVWLNDGPLKVERYDESPPWATIQVGDQGTYANLFLKSAAQCDALIAAATEARAHLTEASRG